MRAKILSPTPENIALAAEAIQRGEVVGMPTETVYGLAGDCRNPLAVARIFETKERPTFDPLIVHVGPQGRRVADLERLRLIDSSKMSAPVSKQVDLLIQKFWPGPLTLVLPKHAEIPDLVTSGLPSVALRMPRHPIAQALIAKSQASLAAPSANRFGRISPTTPEAVLEELGDRIDYILDGGPAQIGIESTVISFDSEGGVWVLRHGGTPQESIEELLHASVRVQSPTASNSPTSPTASPGMLETHYAPKKPLHILPKRAPELGPLDLPFISQVLTNLPATVPIGLLLMAGAPEPMAARLSQLTGHPVQARSLSPNGDLTEAARNLFSEMRLLDSFEVALILSEPCLSHFGLGYAISDRLKRASTR